MSLFSGMEAIGASAVRHEDREEALRHQKTELPVDQQQQMVHRAVGHVGTVARKAVDKLATPGLVISKSHTKFFESEIEVALRAAKWSALLVPFKIIVVCLHHFFTVFVVVDVDEIARAGFLLSASWLPLTADVFDLWHDLERFTGAPARPVV